jgi:hypothetical protein
MKPVSEFPRDRARGRDCTSFKSISSRGPGFREVPPLKSIAELNFVDMCDILFMNGAIRKEFCARVFAAATWPCAEGPSVRSAYAGPGDCGRSLPFIELFHAPHEAQLDEPLIEA